MSRSKKKSIPQKVVGVATTGMPSPVRKTLGNRMVAGLIAVFLPLLLITGVVSVSWENGRPRVSFNQQKAAEVREEAVDRIDDLRDERTASRSKGPNLPVFGGKDKPLQGFVSESRDEQPGKLTDWIGKDPLPQAKAKESPGAFSKIKQRFER